VILALFSDTLTLSTSTKSAVYKLTSTSQGQIGTFERSGIDQRARHRPCGRSGSEIY